MESNCFPTDYMLQCAGFEVTIVGEWLLLISFLMDKGEKGAQTFWGCNKPYSRTLPKG